MNTTAYWRCPKCGSTNVILHDNDKNQETQIAYCDIDGGGCDEMFVVESKRTVEVTAVMSIKVEYAK